ncbi:MAG: DNA gyrase inhibitor YacG [Gammaproteobacteria bacterium]|nr:DNA gyrase inhibitor YacG [Gammaproteobacteria bacterium]
MKGRCPTCKTVCDYSKTNPFRPFCSERCKLIDLGDWLTENNRIPGEVGNKHAGDDDSNIRH